MIKYITQLGKYISVLGGSPSSNYINNYSGAQGVGNLRFNTTNQNIEIYDGNAWIMLNMSHTNVGLTNEAEELLDWVKIKREEERKIKALAETNAAVADQLAAVREAEEKLRMITALVEI
jgi:hypothetical protein